MAKNYKTYDIHCASCSKYLLTYHKYGAGKGILRLYFKNIVAPKEMVLLLQQNDYHSIKDVPNLHCPECNAFIGSPAISKGQKWVFKMRKGYFHRKLVKN